MLGAWVPSILSFFFSLKGPSIRWSCESIASGGLSWGLSPRMARKSARNDYFYIKNPWGIFQLELFRKFKSSFYKGFLWIPMISLWISMAFPRMSYGFLLKSHRFAVNPYDFPVINGRSTLVLQGFPMNSDDFLVNFHGFPKAGAHSFHGMLALKQM